MPSDTPNTPRQPRPPRRGGGGFWLGLSVIIGGIAAVYVFAPELPRKLFGESGRPALGDEPSTAQASSTKLDSREQTATNALTQPTTVARTAAAAAPTDTATAPTAPVLGNYADEAKAQVYLGQAEEAYKAAPAIKDWSKASSAARKIIGLKVKPATMVRAKDIVHGSEAMAKLFKDLDDRDELQRNYDTDPQLLIIGTGSSTSKAVPIISMDSPDVVKGDPLTWVANQRNAGKITLLLLGKKEFMAASLPSDQVTSVERADVPAIIVAKQKEFDDRLARLKNGSLADHALAWYDAAKFAYQNRLDDQVSAMMDRALILDPLLSQSVREDKAATLFANLVLHLSNNSNRKAADTFMGIIARRFADTPSGIQARAFYESRTKQGADDVAKAREALRAARKEAEEREAEAARLRKEQRVSRAKETGDEKQIKEAEKAPVSEPEPEAPGPEASGPVSSGDEAKADDLYAKGEELYRKAIDAGNSSARDDLYGQANKFLTAANNIYNKLCEKDPDNAALSDKNLMCNKLRFGSIKQRRFH